MKVQNIEAVVKIYEERLIIQEFEDAFMKLFRTWTPPLIGNQDHEATTFVNRMMDILQKLKLNSLKNNMKEAKPKREYPADVPNPETQPEEFNEYLRQNNEVVEETAYWIVIKNSYVENQLVMFSTVRGVATIQDFHPKSQPAIEMLAMLSKYSGKHIYINSDSEKSIPNRLHIHIKL